MYIVFDLDPKNAVNEMYDLLKKGLKDKVFNTDLLDGLSERLVELTARTKEANGES